MTESFFQFCDKYFRFLIEEFGCRIVGKKPDSFGGEVTYRNATTAVNVRYEQREHYVFILLCRLVRGKIPQEPIFVHPKTKLYSFYLDDLFTIRSPDTKIRRKPFGDKIPDLALKELIQAYTSEPFTERDLEHMIKTYAAGLQRYAADILRGDFAIFPELDKIVKKRAAEFEKKEKRQRHF